ncbi:MAG: pyrroline-5-carboxylate reductase [Weeksellaceae bacterium]|nr:pyrroline-5-carboxylate reductase [Weeksellaceae bacterium]
MDKVAVLGAGNMGSAIIDGLIKSAKYAPGQIIATRRRKDIVNPWLEDGVELLYDNITAAKEARYIILALQPKNIPEVLNQLVGHLREDHIIISIATGISLKYMRDFLGDEAKVFRAMPNTASAVQEGITCLCAEENDQDQQLYLVRELFESIGEVVVIDETLMDSATIIGACGVAYSLKFMRAMMQGAIQIGFDSKTAAKLVAHMVKGSAEILIENDSHPEAEIDRVTTPMGCTITGLNEMEHGGFSSALIRGVLASYNVIEK